MKKHKIVFILILAIILLNACKQNTQVELENLHPDIDRIIASDTLRIGTMYSPSSYTNYRNKNIGYDIELAENFAEFLNINLLTIEAQSEIKLEQLLEEKKIDIIAFPIYETKLLKNKFQFVVPQEESALVLVQRISTKTLTDVTQLSGKKVHISQNPIYKQRLHDLNSEIANVFEIIEAPDSTTVYDLIELVAKGKIDYTVVHSNTAKLYKSYFKNLNVRLALGFDQKNAWLIRKDSKKLEEKLNEWKELDNTKQLSKKLYQNYWVQNSSLKRIKINIPKGMISPYDHLFKKYAQEIDWDWKLLAALSFQESRFDSSQVSWAGASGLMQLMPRTASNFGLEKSDIFNPEKNIDAAVQYIKSLNMTYRKIKSKDERIKFIIASYNAGPAHIIDAMALASKYGKNPYVWFNNVEYFALKKSEPEFYNDPVVKYGHFRSKETIAHVKNTLETYERYSKFKFKESNSK